MFDATFFVALSFILFVIFVLWAGLPSTIIKSLDDRSEKIKKELDDARILHEEAQKLLATEKRKLEQCDAEVEEILKQASDQAALITEKSKKEICLYKKPAVYMSVKGSWKITWNENTLILNSGDTITFPESLEHNLESSMTGEAALYRIIATDDPAGPTWRQ